MSTSLRLNFLIVGRRGRVISKVNSCSKSYLRVLPLECKLWNPTWWTVLSVRSPISHISISCKLSSNGGSCQTDQSEAWKVGPIGMGSNRPFGWFWGPLKVWITSSPPQTCTDVLIAIGPWRSIPVSDVSPTLGWCLHWPRASIWKGYWRGKLGEMSLR